MAGYSPLITVDELRVLDHDQPWVTNGYDSFNKTSLKIPKGGNQKL